MERNEKLDKILQFACGKLIEAKENYEKNPFLAVYGTAKADTFDKNLNHACHAGMNSILNNHKDHGEVLWNLTSNHYIIPHNEEFLAAQKRILEWMIGPESPYNEYIDRYPFTYEGKDIRSLEFVVKYGIFITNWKTWPSNVLVSYLVFLRMSWEYPASALLWSQLVDRGIHKAVAFFVAYCYRTWDNSGKYEISLPYGAHSLLDVDPSWSINKVVEWLSCFVNCRFNPKKFNKPCSTYNFPQRNNAIFDSQALGTVNISKGDKFTEWLLANYPAAKVSKEIDPWTGKPKEGPAIAATKKSVDDIAHVATILERMAFNIKEEDLDDENK